MRKLAEFEGVWSIDRQIDDRLGGGTGQLKGLAEFVPDGAGLLYTESGLLQFPGQPAMDARQSYLWRAAGDDIEVFFSDGRAFHLISWGDSAAMAQHDCAPDIYRVHYDFTPWPAWTATWIVTGPRKNYVMNTTYRRS